MAPFSSRTNLASSDVGPPPTPALRSAFGGRVVSVPADRDRPQRASEGRLPEEMLVTYVPLAGTTSASSARAVVEIDTDVAAAAVQVGRPFRLVGIALLAGLAAIYVDSAPGEGSRFTVRLPVADAAVERDRQDTDLARS